MEINAEIKKATDPIYRKISSTVPEIEWLTHAPFIEEDKEQPACMSGNKTFFSGLINLAVSAIKCTPHMTIISAFVFAASTAKAKESAEKSEMP